MTINLTTCCLCIALGLVLAAPAAASVPDLSALDPLAASAYVESPVPQAFWPDLSMATLAWFAAVVILALTVRLRPLFSLRNLDALVLIGMCLLLVLRGDTRVPSGGGYSWQWWAYTGLTIAAGYWVLRGVQLLAGSGTWRYEGNVSRGAMTVLLLAGLAIGVYHVSTAPISDGSRDAVVGGLFFNEEGTLPYGQAHGFDAQSPLLYLLHSAAVLLTPPTCESPESDSRAIMTWGQREQWLNDNWIADADLTAARLVNALLFIGMLVGLYALGQALQSAAAGPTMMAIFCVFPGTLECVSRPEIMLPTLLLTWTIVFAFVPVVGGLLATLCLVLAGVAWPWAWLGLPVLLVYFLRRGWHLAGSVIGLTAGVAACAAGLLWLVAPSLPRADGALRTAELAPEYVAHTTPDGILVIDQRSATTRAGGPRAVSRLLWKALVNSEAATMDGLPSSLQIDWPNGVGGHSVLYRTVDVEGDARRLLHTPYRAAIAELSVHKRVFVSLRSVLEATWLSTYEPELPVASAWAMWNGPGPLQGRWLQTRRVVKAGVALLTLLAALAIFFGRRIGPRHLLAGLLVVGSGSLVAGQSGAVTNLVWLLPAVLGLWALYEVPESKVDAPGAGEFTEARDDSDDGVLPRISVDN